MEADKNTNWIGGSKIDGSLRGKLSPHGATIAAYLAEPEWTTESVRFWNAYMSALRDSPDEQMRIAWADAVSKLGDAASPQAGDPVSETVRAVWQDEMAPADTASWWQPNMVLVDYPWLFRATNAVLLKDFGIHAQSPVNAAGDPLIGVAEEVLGNLLDSYLRAHSVTPFGSTLGRVAGVIGLPLLNVFYEADRSDNPEFFLPADPSDPNKGYRAGWLWPGSAKGGAAINAIRAAGQNLSDANVEKLIKAVNALKGELGGSLPIDKRSALGNEFWAPGKIWKPDQVDAVISLFSADIAQQQPPQQLPPASPPQLPPAP
jgi:hypothetical protein